MVQASELPRKNWISSRGTSFLKTSVWVLDRKEWQEDVLGARHAALRLRLAMRRWSCREIDLPVSSGIRLGAKYNRSVGSRFPLGG
jgi:hypothetical protein